MGQPLDDWHCRNVEGVPRRRLKRPDTSLAQDDIVVAVFVHVLGRVEPFLDRCRESAFQQHRLVLPAQLGQQREVRHIAGANPNEIRMIRNELDVARINNFGDEGKTELFSRLHQEFETLFAETLERVRRRPRLEGITSQDRGPRLHDGLGCGEQLLSGLDGARTGDHREVSSTNHGVAHFDDGVLSLEITGDEFEGFEDGHSPFDPGKCFPRKRLHLRPVANDADDRAVAAPRDMRFSANLGEAIQHMLHVVLGRCSVHHDDQRLIPGCRHDESIRTAPPPVRSERPHAPGSLGIASTRFPTLRSVQRVLVTGAATWTGGSVVRELEKRDRMEVFAVDDIEPRIPFESDFQRLSLDRLAFAHHLLEIDPDIVVHLQTVDRSAELGRSRAHEESVVGAQALFGAIGRSPNVRRVIVKSDSAVYGESPRNPSVLTEAASIRSGSSDYQGDLEDMERFVQETALDHPRIDFTIVRFAPIIGPEVANSLTRYLTLPIVPTQMGFDPRFQFIHESDAVAAVLHAVDEDVSGTFNVAAPGQLYLSRVLRLGLRVPQPLPGRFFDSAMRGLARVDLVVPKHTIAVLKHGRVMDTTQMKEVFRFAPRFTCRQAVLDTYGRLPAMVGES